MKRRHLRKSRQGMTLVVVFLVVALVSVLLFSVSAVVRASFSLSDNFKNKQIALEAARAGVNQALYQVYDNQSWTAGFNNQPLPNLSSASYIVTFDSGQTSIPYSTNNVLNSSQVTGHRGRIVPGNSIHLIAVGRYLAGNSQTLENAEALVKVSGYNPWSKYVFFANGTITMVTSITSVFTDSFDSAVGTYAATHQNLDGSIGSNSTGNNAVDLRYNIHIWGDGAVGMGGNPATVIRLRDGAQIHASSYAQSQNFAMPTITAPTGSSLGNRTFSGTGSGTLAPGIYGNITIQNTYNLYLEPGVYVFDSFTSSNSPQVILNAGQSQPTNIYCKGNFDATGCTFQNNTLTSPKLRILGTAGCNSITLSNTSLNYGAIYAPQAAITTRNTTNLYGSMVASSINTRGTLNGHYDKALRTAVLPLDGGGGASLEFKYLNQR